MWIEIGIEDDNGVCAPEIDTNTTSACGQHIDENVGARTIEFIHPFLAFGLLGRTILFTHEYMHCVIKADYYTRRKYLKSSPMRKSSMRFSAMTNYVKNSRGLVKLDLGKVHSPDWIARHGVPGLWALVTMSWAASTLHWQRPTSHVTLARSDFWARCRLTRDRDAVYI